MRLIDADELKRAIEDRIDYVPSNDYDEGWNSAINTAIDEIDNAPTVSKKELQKIFYETAEKPELKEVIAYECGKASAEREQGETNAEIFKTNAEIFKQTFGFYATELWSMSEVDFLKWLNQQIPQFEEGDES